MVVLIPVEDLNIGIEVRDLLRDEFNKLSIEAYFRILEVKGPDDFAYESSILKEGWFVIPWDRSLISEKIVENIIWKAKGSILIIKN